jgi:hypothetical protein
MRRGSKSLSVGVWTRTDNHVIECVNRHTIAPWGWNQEEDNSEVALTADGPRELVREIGANSYVAADDVKGYAADAYWDATGGLWETVRAAWSVLEADGREFAIADDPWGKALYMPMLEIADELADGEIEESVAEAEALALIRARTSGPAAEVVAALDQVWRHVATTSFCLQVQILGWSWGLNRP